MCLYSMHSALCTLHYATVAVLGNQSPWQGSVQSIVLYRTGLPQVAKCGCYRGSTGVDPDISVGHVVRLEDLFRVGDFTGGFEGSSDSSIRLVMEMPLPLARRCLLFATDERAAEGALQECLL
jgi:hypothetical protein